MKALEAEDLVGAVLAVETVGGEVFAESVHACALGIGASGVIEAPDVAAVAVVERLQMWMIALGAPQPPHRRRTSGEICAREE